MSVRKLVQLKTEYVCRRCKQPWAVIVALHRPVTQQTYNRDKGGYDVQAYSGNLDKILYCRKCGTVDLRGHKHQRYLRQATKTYPYWRQEYRRPSLQLVRNAINEANNIREAEIFEQEKEAAREDSDRGSDQEGVPAEVREPSKNDQYIALRVQRDGRK